MTKEKRERSINWQTEFPGIPFAYPIAMESYKTSRERFDLMEKRGQALIVFITTVAVAIVTLAPRNSTAPAVTVSLVTAFVFYVGALIFACGSQMYGKIIVPDPRLLREKALTWEEWSFQNNLIDWAGRHYQANIQTINNRAQMVAGTLAFGLLTLLSLAVWVS